MQTHPIETWFLFLSLFVPRLTLFIAWCTHQIPYNTVPFMGDVIGAIFIPRILILIYIGTCIGYGGWFWAHVVFGICALIGGGITASSKKN